MGCSCARRAKHQATSSTTKVERAKTSGTTRPTCSAGSCGFRFIAMVGAMPATATAIALQVPTPLNRMAAGSTAGRLFMGVKLAWARCEVERSGIERRGAGTN